MSYIINKLTKRRLSKRAAKPVKVCEEYEWKGWDAWVDVKK